VRIAIIGSGIGGLGAAWALHDRHEVTLFEAAGHVGGHANTVEVPSALGFVAVDTGFIVYNEQNYPLLTRLFKDLGVPTEPSDMSFSVSLDDGAFEFRGSTAGLLARPANVTDPATWRIASDIVRFSRTATRFLAGSGNPSLAGFLDDGGFSSAFTNRYLIPLTACIWSATREDILAQPARTLLGFLDNHGLVRLRDRPRWRTVTGGSREYVRRMVAPFRERIRLRTPIVSVRRLPQGVEVRDARGGSGVFDGVVLATHADVSLRLLGTGAEPGERRVLGSFPYRLNRAVLHGDQGLMPRRRRAWASWNYLGEMRSQGDPGGPVSLTYWMNRLQNIHPSVPLFVSLNPRREPRAGSVLGEFAYAHPQFDARSVAAQAELPAIQGVDRVWFAGAWAGFGFHEDGLRSGLAAARSILATADREPARMAG
jgi:predicted NAD/FAD-binding protein